MSRVESDRQAQVDAERLQQRVDRESRDKKTGDAQRDAFGKLMKSQTQAKDTHGKLQKAQGEAKQGEKRGADDLKGQSDAAKRAALARGSSLGHGRIAEQAKSFQGALESTQNKTHEQHKTTTERSESRVSESRVEAEDRSKELTATDDKTVDTRKDGERDAVRAESKEAAARGTATNNAIEGSADQQQREKNKQGQGGGQPQQQPQPQGVAPVQKSAPAHEVKQIPPELLEKLASAIRVGVNEKGLREFQIELKDGVLQGATLRITAENGQVALKFTGLKGHMKNLVESSKGDLMRRLESKGLRLSRIDC
jgi:hypothetical protein